MHDSRVRITLDK